MYFISVYLPYISVGQMYRTWGSGGNEHQYYPTDEGKQARYKVGQSPFNIQVNTWTPQPQLTFTMMDTNNDHKM